MVKVITGNNKRARAKVYDNVIIISVLQSDSDNNWNYWNFRSSVLKLNSLQ